MINFPTAPTNGQTFTSAGITWTWDGSKWTVGAATSGVYLPLTGGTMTGQVTLPASAPVGATDAAPKQYVDAQDTANNALAVQKTGDTMTGPLAGTSANFNNRVTAGAPGFTTDGAAGISQGLGISTSGITRWTIATDASAESGGNAGTNLNIANYSDAGATLGTGIRINRATGNTQFFAPITATGYLGKRGTTGVYGANYWDLYWNSAAMELWNDTTYLGTINVTSDYRVKENVAPLPSSWDQVKALKPISFTYKDYTPSGAREKLIAKSAEPQWGFIAHELQETLLSSAATGTKDEDNVIQSPNWPPIVAALTRALQEAMERIEELSAKVTALEAAR